MKILQVILLLIVCVATQSCEPFCNVWEVYNQSNDTIWVEYSHYPDTTVSNPKYLHWVCPGKYTYWSRLGKEYVMPEGLVFTLFIIENDSVKKYGWDEIERNNICTTYYINKEMYERLDGKFIYPPTPLTKEILGLDDSQGYNIDRFVCPPE